MKKQKIPLTIVLGICLILVGFSLMAIFQIRLYTGAQYSRRIASKMEAILPERTAGVSGIYPETRMPVLELESVDYVALLEIPSFGLQLPVADRWDGEKLSRAPARFFGSAYDNTLVIGGADHAQQFGFCDKIEHGAVVTVTDMIGTQFAYTVSDVDRAGGAKTEWLADADCDLTLFCHDLYSMEYIAVRCVSAFN